MKETILSLKMITNKPLKVFFNPPILNPSFIQFLNYFFKFEGFSIYCDIIDSQFSLVNFPNSEQNLKQSTLLAIFSNDSTLYPKLPIQNKKELSNLTLEVTNEDKKNIFLKDIIYINLKIYHL